MNLGTLNYRMTQLQNDWCTYIYETSHHIIHVVVIFALTYLEYVTTILMANFKFNTTFDVKTNEISLYGKIDVYDLWVIGKTTKPQ